ncbi:MAG: ABC transporter permease [Gemmatimonadales bacterium]
MTRRIALAGWGLALLLAWLVAYPLVLVLLTAVRDAGGWTLEHVRRFASESMEWSALWGSLWISFATVALAGAIGVPLAFLFGRHEFPGRRALGALVALPAVLPPLVGVLAFLFLFGERGFLAHLVVAVAGLDEAPWRLQGAGAILLVHAYSMYVYFYLFTRAALARLDTAQLDAAASLGAGRWRTLWRVILPALRPAIAGAALLTFMTSLGSFSAPYLFGGGFRVMTTQIVSTRLNGDESLAMVQTFTLTAAALVALALFRRLEGAGVASSGAKGVAPARTEVSRGWRRAAVALGAGLVAVVLLLPPLTLLLISFVPAGTWTVEPLPPEWSLGNWTALVRDPERLRPLLNSLWMALLATGASVSLALAVGHYAVRRKVSAGRLLEGLVTMPWAVPGTVFAIALATAFGVNAPWAARVVLIGTLWILPLAYLVRNLPITSRAILAGYRGLDPAQEEAAASLGASRWRILRRVTLPLLRPAIAAGAALAFATALGDFVTSVLLYTYRTRPISMEILASLRQADVGVAAAYGVTLMLVSAAAFRLGAERSGAG